MQPKFFWEGGVSPLVLKAGQLAALLVEERLRKNDSDLKG